MQFCGIHEQKDFEVTASKVPDARVEQGLVWRGIEIAF